MKTVIPAWAVIVFFSQNLLFIHSLGKSILFKSFLLVMGVDNNKYYVFHLLESTTECPNASQSNFYKKCKGNLFKIFYFIIFE